MALWRRRDLLRTILFGGLGLASGGAAAASRKSRRLAQCSYARLMPAMAFAQTVPPSPGRFGAQTHYGQSGWGIAVAQRLGALGIPINRVRDELYWDVLERERGVYRWSAYGDPTMARLAAGGTGVILSFDFGNALYASPGKSFPDTDAARTAFANYVYAVLDRYARPGTGLHPGMIEGIEVWNEANEHWSGGYTAREVAPLLAQLTRAVAARVRADRDFDALPILGCAPVKVPLNFIQWCFDAGIGPAIEKVVVHPYGTPEALMRDVDLLRRQLDRQGHRQEIWATEFGNVTDADELLRLLAACAAAPLETANYYLSKSSGGFRSGLIDGAGEITAVGRAWAAWAGSLDDAVYLGREPLQAKTYALGFRRADGKMLRICWSHWGWTRLHATGDYQAFDSLGAPLAEASPYLLGRKPIVLLGDANLWEDLEGETPLAESFSGFSLIQGENGWSYRYRRRGQDAPMVFRTSGQYGTSWGVNGTTYASVGADGAHPDRIGTDPVAVIRRWTAPRAGRFRAIGSVARPSGQGDGVDAAIERAGEVLFLRQGLVGATAEFDVLFDAAAGQGIDFVTGPRQEQSFDSVSWRIRISAVDGGGLTAARMEGGR